MKMMITKDNAREIADMVIANKTARAQKDAENYVTAVLESAILSAAEHGCESLGVRIPATIEDDLVLAILRENDFTVSNARRNHYYKISW